MSHEFEPHMQFSSNQISNIIKFILIINPIYIKYDHSTCNQYKFTNEIITSFS